MGDYFIGRLEISYDYEDGLKPPSIQEGLLSGVHMVLIMIFLETLYELAEERK